MQVRGESAHIVSADTGATLCHYIHDAAPRHVFDDALTNLEAAAAETDNRGMAAGRLDNKLRTLTKYGSNHGVRLAKSGIVGGFSGGRLLVCRLTAFTADNYKQFKASWPLVTAADAAFKAHEPERYEAQAKAAAKVPHHLRITNTAFTTITVNKNFRTAMHKDAGDYEQGFGVMAACGRGAWSGAELLFPAYNVAIAMRPGGICLANVHEWHCNNPLVLRSQNACRLSLVLYLRERMTKCKH
jgi:hypothetical protein